MNKKRFGQVKTLDNTRIYEDILKQEMNKSQVTNTTLINVSHDGENEVPLIEFSPFKEMNFIRHGFSTRMGGVSEGCFSSMNLTFERGDTKENVHENFNRIAKALDTSVDRMVCSKQTHTTNVMQVDESFCGMGITKPRNFDNVDGLITNCPDVCLVTSYADCVPLYFVDPVKKCIGLSHSGWRGTVGNIAKNTIEEMTRVYGSDPKNIITLIGPSICVDCYEISEDVAEQFRNRYAQEQIDYILKPGLQENKFQLNLQMANYYNMLKAQIAPEHIYISDLCTCCNPDLLFSHRASAGKRGVLCGFLYIRS